MKRTLRSCSKALALGAALGLAALGLSACDGSPPALTVGGRVVSVNTLNHQLAEWVADAPLVQELDQSYAQSAQQGGGQPVTVAGQGSGTYSTQFVDGVLQRNIEVLAVQEYLSQRGIRPTSDQMVAARAYFEVDGGAAWFDMAETVRQVFLQEVLGQAALTPPPADVSALQSAYGQIAAWAFSSICVIEAAAPDLNAAQQVPQAAGGRLNGAQVCFDQEQLEAQPAGLQTAVTGLTQVGQIAKPFRTSYGYEVVQLASRNQPGLTPGVAQVLTAVQSPPAVLSSIIGRAHVVVDPAYGSWHQGCLVPPGETVQEACGSQQ